MKNHRLIAFCEAQNMYKRSTL